MVEFWLVVKQPKPKPVLKGVPVRKSTLSRNEIVMTCYTKEQAIEEATKWSQNNPSLIYIVMHSIAAFGVKDPEPVELEIERVPAYMLPDPPRDDDDDDDDWEEEEEEEDDL